ncbi:MULTISPECIES: hypothetical protein [unclassified Chitinophaga]|uniref:hypothetical protein n=1 Tax=unclassified Chitinophaga TaxID=2619133 RepID=UPI0030102FAA
MKKILLLLLLISAIPLFATAQSNYDHKVIAVLPFRAVFSEYRHLADSNVKEFRAQELKHGMQLQEALYQTIISDTNRLLVEVQPWETTDSILQKAGVDFLKLPYMDMSAIAKVLKVDACVLSIMERRKPHKNPFNLDVALAQAAINKIKRENKIFIFHLIDGKSGNEIWTYSQEMKANDLTVDKDNLIFSPLIFNAFKKRFPYCD